MTRARADARSPAFRRGFARFALAFFGLLVALGYFASLSHMAFVAHTACAEHGKLVHVQSGGRALDAEPSRAVTVAPGDAIASDEHDHCVLGMARPGDARVASAAATVVPHAEPSAVAPLAPSFRSPALVPLPPPIALLLLSPKSSPPV